MGIFDVFKRHKGDAGAMGTALKDRVTGMASGHRDQMDQGMDKAGQMLDDKTGNKYGDQIDTGVGKAKGMVDEQTGQGNGAPNPDQGMQGGDPNQPPQG
jgi:MT0933-like antitoxin protein